MTHVPAVSVMMPVYNALPYVAEAVRSILTQTMGDFELVVIDDGSTDGSKQLLEAQAARDERIRLISRENRGISATRQQMLETARGEYVAVLDADDVALPDRLEKQRAFLDSNSDVVCVGGSFDAIDEAGRFLRVFELPTEHEQIDQSLIRGVNVICHSAVMMRRKVALAVGGYDPLLAPSEDYDLWLRMGEVGRLANLPQVLVRYRYHGSSASSLGRQIQMETARRACERAWKRRGIAGRFEATDQWRPGADRRSRHEFAVRFGWWAFTSRQWKTAAIYGARAVAMRPFSADGWRVLACALLKRTSGGRP